MFKIFNDAGGAELILDADNDTSFTADTDDEIDIKVGGSDRSTIKATGFHNLDSIKYVAGTGDDLEIYHDGTNSLIANKTGALKIATETSGIAITLGHTTSEVTVADNLTVTGTLTVGGTVNFGDFDISNVGSIALDTITNDGTDITLDSSGDIILDSDGADVIFKDAGTEFGRVTNSSTDFVIQTAVSDKDFIIKGNDGGATITPFTIDMSAGGDLFLTGGLIDLKNDGSAVSQIKFYCESSNAHAQTLIGAPHSEGANNVLTLPGTGGDARLVSTASTATLTNKTLTSPVINTGTFGTSILPTSADGTTLGSASKEFSDLFLADAGTIQFGNDQDVTLTHVADTGLLLNTTMVVQFRDSAINIGSPADGDLDINADDEIELNSTLIDVNGNLDVSGTIVGASTLSATTGTFSGILKTDDATEATSTTDGSLQTDGGLSVVKDIVVGDDIKLLSDAAVVHFGADSEITLTHTADTGLILKHTATADDTPIVLTLQTGEVDIQANEVLGAIKFQAPDEASGTDAILVAAGIEAVAEGTFASNSNATKLSFKTAASEAAAEKMSLSSAGNLTVAGTIVPTGAITANAGVVVDNITIDGTEIDLSSGDLTVDVAGDVILDAGGGDFLFNVATTEHIKNYKQFK